MNTNERPTPETSKEYDFFKHGWRSTDNLFGFMRKLERERDEALEELADWRNAAAHVESNHSDEVHCTCVPILQKLLADARKERDEARDRIAELEKQLPELQNPKKPKEKDTFEAHGLIWIKHTPGNFIPCSGDTVARVLLREELDSEDYVTGYDQAACWHWGRLTNKGNEIIGWNYADAP